MSTTLHVAEVARRSGFPPSTLRYYERIGLLSPPERTPAGYRAYDESVLARLGFVARAKALGCSLTEIADLMPHWDGGRCAPVQDGLRGMAATKLARTQARIAALNDLAAELRGMLDTLGSHTPAGPCDADCGCLQTAAPARTPIVCTLDDDDVRGRVQEWDEVLAHATARHRVEGGVRLELDGATPVADLARLVAAERSCCRFFTFTVTFGEQGLALEVRAPSDAQDLVEELFGRPPTGAR